MKRRLYKIDSEDDVQAGFFSWIEIQAPRIPELNLFFAVPNGGFRHLTTAMRLKKTGVKAGIPDTFLPVSRGGKHGLWIEFKSAKGKTSISQNQWIERLKIEGYEVRICFDWKSAALATIEYLGLPIKI